MTRLCCGVLGQTVVQPAVGWSQNRGDGVKIGELPVLVHLWVGTRAHPLQERFVRNESIVILRVAALLDQDVHLLPLQLLTEREEDVLQLAQHHRPVLHLVVQLQTLNEVLERTGILGVLHLLVDGVELFQLEELLSLLLRSSQFVNHFKGWVEIQTTQTVAKVEKIHSRFALKVINVEGKLCTFNILWCKISHCDLWGSSLLSHY